MARFSAVESRVDGLETSLGDHFSAASLEISTWRSSVDSAMADLSAKVSAVDSIQHQIGALHKKIDRVVLDRPSHDSGILPNPLATAASPSAGNPVVGPEGHRVDRTHQETGFGSVLTYTHLAVTGTPPSASDFRTFRAPHVSNSTGSFGSASTGRLPKLSFPKFDGENPKL